MKIQDQNDHQKGNEHYERHPLIRKDLLLIITGKIVRISGRFLEPSIGDSCPDLSLCVLH